MRIRFKPKRESACHMDMSLSAQAEESCEAADAGTKLFKEPALS